MKKNLLLFVVASSCFVLSAGCTSSKKICARGWIGGYYLESNPSLLKKLTANYFKANHGVIPALPDKIKKSQASAVFVSRVYEDTPVMNAGIKEGDLIISVDNQPVETVGSLQKLVDESRPGKKIMVSVFREGELKDFPVVVGHETYQKWGYFNFGFRLGTEFNPIPHPEFSILSIVSFKTNDTRLELKSPEYKYYRNSIPLPPGKSDRNPYSDADSEGWDAWFVIFGLAGKKVILDQKI